jgi:hypothetical protein
MQISTFCIKSAVLMQVRVLKGSTFPRPLGGTGGLLKRPLYFKGSKFFHLNSNSSLEWQGQGKFYFPSERSKGETRVRTRGTYMTMQDLPFIVILSIYQSKKYSFVK